MRWYPVVTSSPLDVHPPFGSLFVYTCSQVVPPFDDFTVLPKSLAKRISGLVGDTPIENGFSPQVGPNRSLIHSVSTFADGTLPAFVMISFQASVHVFPKSMLFATPICDVSLFTRRLLYET